MARIQTDTIVIELSKIYKNDDDSTLVLSDEHLFALNAIVEETLADLLGDSVVIEINRAD